MKRLLLLSAFVLLAAGASAQQDTLKYRISLAINKAIRRSGGKTDYWEIYNYLPKETRGYVPAFIAANYVMTYYCKHNICPMETDIPEATDTVQVSRNNSSL